MSKYLLDTNILVWSLFSPDRLSLSVREILLSEESHKYLSIVSIWELAIKSSIGKFPHVIDWSGYLEEQPVQLLQIEIDHVEKLEVLPHVHKDPFDRLLISTCMCEDMTLLSSDKKLKQYGISIIH